VDPYLAAVVVELVANRIDKASARALTQLHAWSQGDQVSRLFMELDRRFGTLPYLSATGLEPLRGDPKFVALLAAAAVTGEFDVDAVKNRVLQHVGPTETATADEVAERVASEIRRLLPRTERSDREAILLSIDLLRSEFIEREAGASPPAPSSARAARLSTHLYSTLLDSSVASSDQGSVAANLGFVDLDAGVVQQDNMSRTSETFVWQEALGRSLAIGGRFPESASVFSHAASEYETTRDKGDLQTVFRLRVLEAHALIAAGDFGRVDARLATLSQLADEIGTVNSAAQTYWTQFRYFDRRFELEAAPGLKRLARRFLWRAIDQAEQSGVSPYDVAAALQLLAHIEIEAGYPDPALKFAGEVIRLQSSGAISTLPPLLHIEIARAYLHLGRLRDAAKEGGLLLERVDDLDPESRANGYTLLGDVFSLAGDSERAILLYETAVEIFIDVGATAGAVKASRALAEIFESRGDTGRALQALRRGVGMDPHEAA
jgi:tetratricopeptide (TPR) repeat protein